MQHTCTPQTGYRPAADACTEGPCVFMPGAYAIDADNEIWSGLWTRPMIEAHKTGAATGRGALVCGDVGDDASREWDRQKSPYQGFRTGGLP